jgi:hypothetical protein
MKQHVHRTNKLKSDTERKRKQVTIHEAKKRKQDQIAYKTEDDSEFQIIDEEGGKRGTFTFLKEDLSLFPCSRMSLFSPNKTKQKTQNETNRLFFFDDNF